MIFRSFDKSVLLTNLSEIRSCSTIQITTTHYPYWVNTIDSQPRRKHFYKEHFDNKINLKPNPIGVAPCGCKSSKLISKSFSKNASAQAFTTTVNQNRKKSSCVFFFSNFYWSYFESVSTNLTVLHSYSTLFHLNVVFKLLYISTIYFICCCCCCSLAIYYRTQSVVIHSIIGFFFISFIYFQLFFFFIFIKCI